MGDYRRLPLLTKEDQTYERIIIQGAMTLLPASIVPSAFVQGNILPREAGRHPLRPSFEATWPTWIDTR